MSTEENEVRRRGRRPSRGIQRELKIPGDEKLRPRVPAKLKELLEPYCEVIAQRSALSQQEGEYKASMLELMTKHNLSEVHLPNGGSLIRKPGKPRLQYVAPKATRSPDDGADDTGDESEE